MFNQTQMIRERHQVSHLSPGRYTLRTPEKRARGGGVAFGEMEVQVAVAAGLQCCVEETVSRGDQVVCKVCTQCQRLGLLCTCTEEDLHVDVTLPYDTVVLDICNYVIHKC